MKLSTKSEYALLAMIDLAENHNKEYIKIQDISKRKKIPRKFLEQILLILNRAGFVKSKRGAIGGYILAKDPRKITLAEVVRLMDGALAPVGSVSTYFFEETPIKQNKNLLKVFKEIRDYIAKKMETTTLADLVKK